MGFHDSCTQQVYYLGTNFELAGLFASVQIVNTKHSTVPMPQGFRSHVANLGIKDGSDDFVIIAADQPCSAVGMFTKSLFAGPSVKLSKKHLVDGQLQAIVTISKNANVATGLQGERDAFVIVKAVASLLECRIEDVAIGSTGVIGQPYPMDAINKHLGSLHPPFAALDMFAAAHGIMTTDTQAKLSAVTVGPVTVAGIAKGVGMIEPDMATMLAYILTDAEIPSKDLKAMFERVVAKTFNCVSIDSDTSTSDTAIVLASGLAGSIDAAALEGAIETVALNLTKQIARDGEGATKLIEVQVQGAADIYQARRVGKAIVNSPLVKTAVHGSDPNWGRVVMAIGKCSQDTDINTENVIVQFGDIQVYPPSPLTQTEDELRAYMSGSEVIIRVHLGTGRAEAVVWGCDLSADYVRINADYTT